ncbi:MAG: PKD domain-containing protein [Thermoplasmata archaeon]|nr:PKD domain-containing protein [Thermoplasmata archaeon]
MAFDSTLAVVVLFGGIANRSYFNDTWEFANGTWSNVTAAVGKAPAARQGAAMADDPVDGYLVLWGGANSADTPDTWILNGTGWHHVSTPPAQSPPACYLCNMAWDAADRYVLLFDGYSSAPTAETWKFSGGAWSRLNNTGSGTPSATEAGGMDYDPNAKAALYYDDFPNTIGQDGTWAFAGGTWTSLGVVPTPTRAWPALTFDAVDNFTVLFGGTTYSLSAPFQYNDTWGYEGGTWLNLTSQSGPAPPARWGHAMAFDPHDGYVVLFSGAVEYSTGSSGYMGGYANDTWTFGIYSASRPPPPSVTPSANRTTTDVGLPVKFTAAPGSYGTPPFTYVWAFGDGGGSSAPMAIHIYANAGTYRATVTITDAHGASGNGSLQEIAHATPSAHELIFPGLSTDLGKPVLFNASAAGGTPPFRWNWSFGDGSFASAANATHTFGSVGAFVVQLVAWDAFGVRCSATGTETVAAAPTVGFTANPGVTDVGIPISFLATAWNGTSPFVFSWDFGDGTPGSGPQVVHTFGTPGSRAVNLVLTDGVGAHGGATVGVTIHPALNACAGVAPGSFQRADPCKAGSLAHGNLSTPFVFGVLVSGGTGPITYAWQLGDGASASTPTVYHNFTAIGNYSGNVVVTDAAGVSVREFVNVSVTPNAPSSTGPGPHGPSGNAGGFSLTTGIGPFVIVAAVGVAVGVGYLVLRGRRGPPRSEIAETSESEATDAT